MKKHVTKILILIAILGFFIPDQIKAQGATGFCAYEDGTPVLMTGATPENCRPPYHWVEAIKEKVVEPESKTNTDTTYTPLAPLPGLGTEGCKDENGAIKTDTDGKPVPCIDTQATTDNPCPFGKYLNAMIVIIIGLISVGAVVMITIGGIEYMTSELISDKAAGKEKIENALLGIVIALGSYALLNTINPKILSNVCLNIPKVEITIMPEGETLADAVTGNTGIPPSTPTAICPSGIQKTSSGMFACGSIAQNLDSMIVLAKSSGLNITGGGYRTIEAQTALRIKNCKGDSTNRNATCVPPTALPGLSRHNNGLAFDLKCEGTLIQTKDNACFVWLKTNAGQFGLYNLSSEPWHWSIDGK